ncbi:hypothetical protein X743_33910 [Mesorhizobium sp. LNHC252B00]|nr:hypothetical protein X743_33910 [Mesorhizobium sp. LNHC252B00]
MWDLIERRTAKYGPGNQYSVNYMWGTVGLGPIVSGIGASNQRGAVHDLEGTLFDASFTVAIARPCAEAERFLEDETLAAGIMDIRLFRSREKH